MASAETVAKHLRERLLPKVDFNNTTEKQLREMLERELGQPMDEHKDLIRSEVADWMNKGSPVSPETVVSHLKELLSETDANTTTPKKLRSMLAERIGKPVEEHKELIKEEAYKWFRTTGMVDQETVLKHLGVVLENLDIETAIQGVVMESLIKELGNSVEQHTGIIQSKVHHWVAKMVENKRKRKAAVLDNTTTIHEETEDFAAQPKPKIAKPGPSMRANSRAPVESTDLGKQIEQNPDGGIVVKLSNSKRASISSFKGINRVDLRGYFQKDGEWLPTKKGISLPEDQWDKLVDEVHAITAALRSEDTTFEIGLSDRRLVKISLFNGRAYVGIREYYEKDGNLLPGRTGLNLDDSQWNVLTRNINLLNRALKQTQ